MQTLFNPSISGSRGKVVFIQIGDFMHKSDRICFSDFNDTNKRRYVYSLFSITSYNYSLVFICWCDCTERSMLFSPL